MISNDRCSKTQSRQPESRSVKTFAWMIALSVVAAMGCRIGAKYSVGGTLTGLVGRGLVLQDNAGNDLEPGRERRLRLHGAASRTTAPIRSRSRRSLPIPRKPARCTMDPESSTKPMSPMSSFPARKQGASPTSRISCPMTCRPMPLLRERRVDPIAGSPFPATGTAPASLAVDPNGRFLYVVNNGSSDISVFAIDNATGALTAPVCRAPRAAARMPWPSIPGISIST